MNACSLIAPLLVHLQADSISLARDSSFSSVVSRHQVWGVYPPHTTQEIWCETYLLPVGQSCARD